jgi:hypothetical protein
MVTPPMTRPVSGTSKKIEETPQLRTIDTPTANVFWMLSAYLRVIETTMPPSALSATASHATQLKPTSKPPWTSAS